MIIPWSLKFLIKASEYVCERRVEGGHKTPPSFYKTLIKREQNQQKNVTE